MTQPFDIGIASFLLDSNLKSHDLSSLAQRYLAMDPSDVHKLTPGQQTGLIAQLRNIMEKQLEEQGLASLLLDVEVPLGILLGKIEAAGVAIDTSVLTELSKQFTANLHNFEKQIYDIAGETFNIGSPKQLQYILFEKLGLSSGKKTKTGLSTNAKVLSELANDHPIASLITEYRQMAKLLSTYIEALPTLINPITKRIHTTFGQTNVATGRISSNNPNLQNIPIRTPEGRSIRKAFIANPGCVLLSADYSQIELRLLAHFSQDKTLIRAFRENKDIHSYTASLIFKKAEDKVEQMERRMAKTVNFGIIYGMGAFRLSQDLKISRQEANTFIQDYFATYSDVKTYMDNLITKARTDGYLTTLLGRRRYFPDLNSSSMMMVEAAKREATNYPLQGSAADIIKIAMLNVDRELQKRKLSAQIVLQVHDELLLEVPKDEVEEVTHMVKHEMEHALILDDVPVLVEVGVGQNWLEAH